jgi:tRNA modification GTPase
LAEPFLLNTKPLSSHTFINSADTIVALATPPGVSALAVIRVSGKEAISVTNKVFKGKDLTKQASHTLHFGKIAKGDEVIDEVLVSVFVAPRSFTGENLVEISCHGSNYIVAKILKTLVEEGARYAQPGEFTRRAFLNGKFDLVQAEAIADLIHSDSEISHHMAMSQMRGGFSQKISYLREHLVNFASLLELELDFSEEDVEFADRTHLKNLIVEMQEEINVLADSFELGNVLKEGVPTVIAGKPNAGKSTLLNALLNEDKAMVSEIAGTTRDVIEDEISIGGIKFRFIDTAGLRETEDKLEAMGIARTRKKMDEASLIIYLYDINTTTEIELEEVDNELKKRNVPYLLVANKVDKSLVNSEQLSVISLPSIVNRQLSTIHISASSGLGIEALKERLLKLVKADGFKSGNTIVTNARHHENLVKVAAALQLTIDALDKDLSNDFLALEVRQALHYLGELTGTITTEDLLGNIFSKFCIGK